MRVASGRLRGGPLPAAGSRLPPHHGHHGAEDGHCGAAQCRQGAAPGGWAWPRRPPPPPAALPPAARPPACLACPPNAATLLRPLRLPPQSTMFNALCENAKAQAANFPFCTIEPNVGIVAVPDPRLEVGAGPAGWPAGREAGHARAVGPAGRQAGARGRAGVVAVVQPRAAGRLLSRPMRRAPPPRAGPVQAQRQREADPHLGGVCGAPPLPPPPPPRSCRCCRLRCLPRCQWHRAAAAAAAPRPARCRVNRQCEQPPLPHHLLLRCAVPLQDIAGLVKGASKGEGLGNQFLANIRECDSIVQVGGLVIIILY